MQVEEPKYTQGQSPLPVFHRLPPKKIGNGAYGCVYAPPLHCENEPELNYENKASKLVIASEAKLEEKSGKLVDAIDPLFQFHLRPSHYCDFDNSESEYVEDCNAYDIKKNLKTMKNGKKGVKVVLMENGGENLFVFIHKFVNPSFGFSKTRFQREQIVYQFWANSVYLIYGISQFRRNHLIHRDLKGGNILIDHETMRLNIIDFGMMTKDEDYSPYGFHYNFPPEYGINTEITFNQIANSKDEFFRNFFSKNVRFKEAYESFLNDVVPLTYSPENAEFGFLSREDFLSKFDRNFYRGQSYDNFKEAMKETADIYGMGMSLLMFLVNTSHYIVHKNFVKKMYQLLLRTVHPNCFERIRMDELESAYEAVIELLPINMPSHITNFRIPTLAEMRNATNASVDNKKAPSVVAKKASRKKKTVLPPSSKEPVASKQTRKATTRARKAGPSRPKSNSFIEDISLRVANLHIHDDKEVSGRKPAPKPLPEPLPIAATEKAVKKVTNKECEEGKERHPITNQCVKKCAPGFLRDPISGKCNKVKKTKSQLMLEPCPEGKERNPVTGYCVNKCPEGYLRNPQTGYCNKTFKLRRWKYNV